MQWPSVIRVGSSDAWSSALGGISLNVFFFEVPKLIVEDVHGLLDIVAYPLVVPIEWYVVLILGSIIHLNRVFIHE